MSTVHLTFTGWIPILNFLESRFRCLVLFVVTCNCLKDGGIQAQICLLCSSPSPVAGSNVSGWIKNFRDSPNNTKPSSRPTLFQTCVGQPGPGLRLPYRVPTTFPCNIPLIITETQLGTACTCFQFSSFSVQRANPFQPGGSAHQSASADARKHAHTQWLLAQGPRMFCFLAKHSHFECYDEAPVALLLVSSLLGLPNSVRIPSICSNSLLFRETGKYILLKL
jgi:hypothetical protein